MIIWINDRIKLNLYKYIYVKEAIECVIRSMIMFY